MRFGRWLALGVMGASLALSGCADYGIDLNGKIFDWMGISASALASRRAEPKLAERAPLVLPPDNNRLPEPGSEQAPQTAMAWPDDAEQRKQREAKERERLHLAYCRGDIQWKERAMNPYDVNVPRSPFGPCPSLVGDLGSVVNK